MARKLYAGFFVILSVIHASCAVCDSRDVKPLQVDVGVIVPMTGGWKTWGDRLTNALEMFRQDQAQRVAFQFHYQDEATCDSGKALQAYKFLRSIYNVKIFVVCCMNGTRAILPLAKKDGVLLLSAGFQEQNLFSEDGVLINLALQIGSEAQKLGALIESAGVRKLALLRSAGTDDFLNGMREYFKAAGRVEIVYDEALEGSERDVASLVLQVRSHGADGLFVNLSEPQLLEALRSLKTQHIEPVLFSSYGIEGLAAANPEVRQLGKGLIFTRALRPESPEFDALFKSKFSAPPVVNVYFLYDGMAILTDALESCVGLETRCLYNFFASNSWRSGYGGEFRIHRDGTIERTFEARRLDN